VDDGVVTLTGQLERWSSIPIVVGLVHGRDGVVDQLTFEVDDSPIMVPSDLLMNRAPRGAAGSSLPTRRGQFAR